MEDGYLAAWRKQAGDRVEAGETLADVETEKVNNELESPVSGVIRQILVAEGTEEVPVGTVLCIIDED
jgi:pyruvate/2-oxoglutarate dehydrogenase complex dihydrolipoamide acyltransferase (E2) component